MNVNVNCGGYVYPLFIDTTRYPDISFADDLIVRILSALTLLLIPSTILFNLAMWVLTKVYEYRESNTRLVALIASGLYLLNVFTIPLVVLHLSGQLTPVTGFAGAVLSLFVFSLVSLYRYNTIVQMTKTTILKINKQIDEAIAKEKGVERQRIVAEALLTIKKTLESLNLRSISVYYALISIAFIYEKLKMLDKDQSKKRYDSLERETKQARALLAEAYA